MIELVTVSNSTFEFLDKMIVHDTIYYYVISASNSIGEGDLSGFLSISIPRDIITTTTTVTVDTEGNTVSTNFGSLFFLSLVLVSIAITRRKSW